MDSRKEGGQIMVDIAIGTTHLVPFSCIPKLFLGWKHNKNVFLLRKWRLKNKTKQNYNFVVHVCNRIMFLLCFVFSLTFMQWKNKIQQKYVFVTHLEIYQIELCFHFIFFIQNGNVIPFWPKFPTPFPFSFLFPFPYT